MFQQVAGQVIVAGMGDILGIKFEAIQFIFDLYEFNEPDERRDLFEKIMVIDHARMKQKRDEIIRKQKIKGK